MRIVIISDIHGNYDALQGLQEDYDELWVLGDLVNYGPEPREVVAAIMAKASVVIRGNHDDAVISPDPAPWMPRWQVTAEATRRFTASVLPSEQAAYLKGLPLATKVERDGTTFFLVHATPSDPLYGHHPPGGSGWAREVEDAGADILLVGHSHVPFIQQVGHAKVVNPGSIGQPRNGDTRASYAVWEDGRLALKSYAYQVAEPIRKLRDLAFAPEVEEDLVAILESGRV